MTLESHLRDWEDLALVDPYWAVLSYPERKHGGWSRDDFFATGEEEIAQELAVAAELGLPSARGAALDFGCGVGRLTRALASRFDRAVGVDISPEMISQACRLNDDIEHLEFQLNQAEDLRLFEDASFDLVYTNAVLQHLPNGSVIRRYLAELVRVLKPDGLLIFRLPSHIPMVYRLQVGRKAYRALKLLGLRPEWLYGRLGLQPMRMRSLPTRTVASHLTACGGRLLREHTVHEDWGNDLAQRLHLVGRSGIDSTTYYVTRPAEAEPAPIVEPWRPSTPTPAPGTRRPPRSRGELVRRLARRDRRLLLDYVGFLVAGKLGRAERLEHHRVPGALNWSEGLATIEQLAGRWDEGPGLALARATRLPAGHAGSAGGAAAEHLAGDETLGELLYALIRATRPDVVIETGVAAGVTSAFALAALDDNGHGLLHSIDLPPSSLIVDGLVGVRVPDALRARWRFHWGDTRRLLPGVLTATSGRRIFVHDSDHGYRAMRWELERAWDALAPGDWLVADDVDLHDAFTDVAIGRGARAYVIAQRGELRHAGVMRRN